MATPQPKVEQQNAEVPSWLRRHANAWIDIPGVAAVVLFGSRALGCARKDSDWDVAILHVKSDSIDLPMGSDLESHPVDIPQMSLDEYEAEAQLVGSLAHELAANGRILAGDLPTPKTSNLVVSEVELARHLEYAFYELSLAVAVMPMDMSLSDADRTLNRIEARHSSTHSANGAERVVKALCVHLGVTYDHIHNVKKLSRHVQKERREKVLAMNGHMRRAHIALHRGSSESMDKVVRRVSVSLELLSEILVPCCRQLSIALLRDLDLVVEKSLGMNQALEHMEENRTHSVPSDLVEKLNKGRGLLGEHLLKRER